MTRARLKSKDNCSSGVPLQALGVIAMAAGLYHQSAGAVGLGVVFLLTPTIVYIALKRSASELVLRRAAPKSAYEGDRIEVRLQLENRSRLPVFFPKVSEVFGPEIHAQKDVLFPDRVRAGEKVDSSYHGSCALQRGVYTIGPTLLTVSDPFGWFQLKIPLSNSRQIKVYPKLYTFGVKERLGERIAHISSDLTRAGTGESTEFFSVREYRVGDALRRVHWGLTAHLGFPVVREFARNSTGDMSIFLDSHRLALIGISRLSSLEYSVKIAATLAAKAVGKGFRVHLVAGDRPDLEVQSSAGSVHFQRLLDVLVRVKPTSQSSLPAVLAKHAIAVKPGSTAVVMVSPYLYQDTELEARLHAWKRSAVRVVAVVFDAKTFSKIWGSPESFRHEDDDSEDFCQRLRARGIEVYLLSCAADLDVVFARSRS